MPYGVDPNKTQQLLDLIARNQSIQANAVARPGPSLMNGPQMLQQAQQQDLANQRAAQQGAGPAGPGFLSDQARMQVMNSPNAIKVPMSGPGPGGPNPLASGRGLVQIPGQDASQSPLAAILQGIGQ